MQTNLCGPNSEKLKERFSEHTTSVRKKANNAVGAHFNGPGHSLANMNILALEKVYSRGTKFIEKRESLWINQLEAQYKGINRNK